VLKFLAAGVTFYGMSTFEGPLLSVKAVSALGHYTDWIIGHVHGGALGWNGFIAAGMFYWLVPRLFGTKLHSTRMADAHFWIGTAGILLYLVSMWVSGISQGLMWRAFDGNGALLYPDFVETLLAIRPLYVVRLIGGTLYLTGFAMMAYNLVRTALAGKAVNGEVTVLVETRAPAEPWGWRTVVFGRPLVFSVAILAVSLFMGWARPDVAVVLVAVILALAAGALLLVGGRTTDGKPRWHAILEGKGFLFTVLTLAAVLVGGVAELVPTLFVKAAVPKVGPEQVPYTALELEGRDLYVREGCYTCHSQMIRPFRSEKLRYGDPSRAEESQYDHPFQWGSKRTGPDLARVGPKYPNLWHYTHLLDPRATSPGSNMPAFPWLAERPLNPRETPKKLALQQRLGVPYSNADVDGAEAALEGQAKAIAADLRAQGVEVEWNREIVALIAYLQKLGRQAPPAPGGQLNASVAQEGR
jgi:cytochrome c oxidase cbb3-type subunit I/II